MYYVSVARTHLRSISYSSCWQYGIFYFSNASYMLFIVLTIFQNPFLNYYLLAIKTNFIQANWTINTIQLPKTTRIITGFFILICEAFNLWCKQTSLEALLLTKTTPVACWRNVLNIVSGIKRDITEKNTRGSQMFGITSYRLLETLKYHEIASTCGNISSYSFWFSKILYFLTLKLFKVCFKENTFNQ